MAATISPLNGETYPQYRIEFSTNATALGGPHQYQLHVALPPFALDTSGQDLANTDQITALEAYLTLIADALGNESEISGTPIVQRYDETPTTL